MEGGNNYLFVGYSPFLHEVLLDVAKASMILKYFWY